MAYNEECNVRQCTCALSITPIINKVKDSEEIDELEQKVCSALMEEKNLFLENLTKLLTKEKIRFTDISLYRETRITVKIKCTAVDKNKLVLLTTNEKFNEISSALAKRVSKKLNLGKKPRIEFKIRPTTERDNQFLSLIERKEDINQGDAEPLEKNQEAVTQFLQPPDTSPQGYNQFPGDNMEECAQAAQIIDIFPQDKSYHQGANLGNEGIYRQIPEHGIHYEAAPVSPRSGTVSAARPVLRTLFKLYLDVKPKNVEGCYVQIGVCVLKLSNTKDTLLWEGEYETFDVQNVHELRFGVRVIYLGYGGLRRCENTVPCIAVVSPSPYIFIRVSVYKTNEVVDAFSEIITDLINRCRVDDIDIKECILQMESFTEQKIKHVENMQVLSLHSIKLTENSKIVAEDVRARIQHKLTSVNVLAYCYFLSVVGKGFKVEHLSDIQRFFTKQETKLLFRSFEVRKKDDIPSTCIPAIASILPDLFKFCYEKQSSVLLYIGFTYNMMDEVTLLSFIERSLQRREHNHFPFFEESDKFDFVDLVIRLYIEALSNEHFALLSKVLELLPRNIHRRFLEMVCQKNLPWHDVLADSMNELECKDKNAFKDLSYGNDLQGVLNLWYNVAFSKLENSWVNITQTAEKTMLVCLEKIEEFSETNLLLSVMNDTRLFNDKTQCLKVLKIISTSKCVELRGCFINLLDNEKFVSLKALETSQLIDEWYCNELEIPKRKVKQHQEANHEKDEAQRKIIVEVYHKFAEALKTAHISKNESIKEILEESIFNFLQLCSFKALILVVQQNIEKNGDLKEIQESVSMHIRKLLTNGHVGKKPNFIMQDICGKDKLFVNSSVTAKMIIAILDTMDVQLDETLSDLAIKQVIESSKVWNEVLSGKGKKINEIHKHPAVTTVQKSLQMLRESIDQQSISCKFLLFLQKKEKEVHDIFCGDESFMLCLKRCTAQLTKFQNNIEAIEETFRKVIAFKIPEITQLSMRLLEYTKQQKDQITSGKLTIRELFSSTSCIENIESIAISCTMVHRIVSTCVFWNILKKILKEEPVLSQSVFTIDQNVTEGTPSSFMLQSIQRLLQIIVQCQSRYIHMWNDYATEMKQGVGFTARVFDGVTNMDLEISEAEIICSLNFPQENRKSLLRFSKISNYKETVELIKVAAKAFEFENNPNSLYTETIDKFEAMIKGNFSDLALNDIIPVLNQVHTISEIINDNLRDILQGIKESSSLLDFLREVIDDDIRNLIDAVEEHSEQYVRESTVSDLIEVKRFFQPVLKASLKTNIGGLFQLLNKQVNEAGILAVRQKMFSCRDNLHSLRALYRNVANRGEHTYELIDNIMLNGKFHLRLDNRKCDIFVVFEQDRKGYTPAASDLNDLRSRALLIMNADKKDKSENKDDRKETLGKFIEVIDDVFDVSNICINLKHAGHFEYFGYEKVCRKDEMAELKDSLQKQYKHWISEINDVRRNYYYMNFLFSDQLFAFYTYLNKDTQNDDQIISALKYMKILPENENLHQVLNIHRMFPPPKNHRTALENIGKTLQKLHDQTLPKELPQIGERTQVSLIEKVHPGKPYFAWLDEGSTLVIRTLLALYSNTTNILPQAHQVLFCREDTTFEEIDLLIKRCIQLDFKTSKMQLFSIVNVENLKMEVQISLHDRLHELPNEHFLLCLICRGNENHPFLDQFTELLLRLPPFSEEKTFCCLEKHCSSVTVVTSDVPGAGKTEFIQSKAILRKMRSICLHISGPLKRLSIIEDLQMLHLRKYHVLHIDIGGVSDPLQLDTFLFELLVLKYVSCGATVYALPCDQVFIEIANTVKDTLCNSLPSVAFFKREHMKWNSYDDLKVSMEINSPVQVVCNYLNALKKGTIDVQDLYFNGPKRLQPLSQEECQQLFKIYFNTSSDISYTLVNIFTRVLADQLKKLSSSIYFRTESIAAMLGNEVPSTVKSNLVNALMNIAKEFSSRSVHTCRSTQSCTILGEVEKEKDVAEILTERLTGMIRWDESNHLMILFHQNMQTVSPLYRSLGKLPPQIVELFERQMKRKLDDFNEKTTEELEQLLVMLTRQSRSCLSSEMMNKLRINYALTPDNLLKMVLISLRVNANIPVLIMGETGCGKTSLIRYLSQISGVTLDVFSIHAGIDISQIKNRLQTANSNARQNLKVSYWLFLDEVNTCDHIGLITSIVCHRFYQGIQLSSNLTLLAACNPYRLRRKESILTAGLQGKIKIDDRSKLVYRVHPLPESLIDFVWDYGSLRECDEEIYIRKMVETVKFDENLTHILVKVCVMSQRFVRDTEKNEYCVSLRDVDRCRRLVKWFDTFLKQKDDIDDAQSEFKKSIEDRRLKSIILSLAVCYQSRFTDGSTRYKFREKIGECMTSPKRIIPAEYIRSIILDEQKDILKRMAYLPEGTALNAALQENVFMLLVCILCKIPIFLVGKPGCSKSLSIQLIRSNLRGKDSYDPLFQHMPQLFCVSFQGSESSTSDGVMKVFEKAQKYQTHNDEKDVLSVVILDEIGLAEISRFNPLKVLHGLLEPDDGTTLDIAVVGISNWALDAAKMNRAIHLSRPDMDLEELKITGKFIGESMINEKKDGGLTIPSVTQRSKNSELDKSVSAMLDGIATAYNDYCSRVQKFQNFHGLRDFYSLTKYVARNMNTGEKEMSVMLSTGILRNFGGLPTEQETLLSTFQKYLPLSPNSIPVIELIRENIQDRASRHLMLLTSGDVVISVLERELYDMGISFDIIFGSSFEEDLNDDYNYRILSRIILCMEQGIVLILKDLEAIYGSLYDMLNQNYTVIGNKKNCRVALGQYSNPMCHVHDDFKCIVLVEESRLDFSDPPFLNRFEKQHFEFKDLVETDTSAVDIIKEEMTKFCKLPNQRFVPEDIIPTYSEDLLVSLVVRSKQVLGDEATSSEVKSFIYDKLLWLLPPEVVIRAKDSVLFQTKAALVGEHMEHFMKLPVHGGISTLFEQLHFSKDKTELSNNTFAENNVQCFFIYTYSSLHSIIEDTFGECKVQKFKMAIFKSEKQFSATIENFFQTSDNVLIIQCTAATELKYLLLSKVIIEKTIRQLRLKNVKFRNSLKCIYMVIHLGRNRHQQLPINFLSEWKLLYLDTIHNPSTSLDHFISVDKREIVSERCPLTSYIKESLFMVFTRIKFTSGYTLGTSLNIVNNLECILTSLRTCSFAIETLESLVVRWINSQTPLGKSSKWCISVAKNSHELMKCGTLIGALENTVKDFIREPLAMFIFKIIDMNLLSPVFVEDDYTSTRRDVWQRCVLSPEYLDISGIPKPSGPECYSCSSEFLNLKMPYSQSFTEIIDQRKIEFMEVLKRLQNERYEDPDEEVSKDIFNDTIQTCGHLVSFDPVGVDFSYEGRNDDYIHDFCNIYSLQMSFLKDRVLLFQWSLSQFINLSELRKEDFHTLFTTLHASIWVYGFVIEAVFEMARLPNVSLELMYDCLDTNQASESVSKCPGKILRMFELNRKSFVKEICLSLLPTPDVLECYSSIDNWLSVVRRLLPLARIVDVESNDILALRFCQEIADAFTHFDLKNMDYIHPVAKSLQTANGEIDSPKVCRGIFQTLFQSESTKAVHVSTLQGLFCSYICRCLSVSPENEFPFEYALEKICTDSVFEKSLDYFGQVFKYAFKIDMYDNDDVFIEILTGIQDRKETKFCSCLNEWLERLDITNVRHTYLSVLLVDVLEEIAFNEELEIKTVRNVNNSSSPILKHLGSAVTNAKQEKYSIHTIVSIAYIRKFMKTFFCILESERFECSEISILSLNVNAVLRQDEGMGFSSLVSSEILHLFLKMLHSISELGNIRMNLNKICNTITVLQKVAWNDSKVEWPVFCPFYRIDKKAQTYEEILQEILSIGSNNDNLKNVLNNSVDSSLDLLCILSQRFYMKLCLQERDDNEKRAAKQLYAQIEASDLQKNTKNIARRLLGIKEFKHNLFNLSEMVDFLNPQIVSLMIHLTGVIAISKANTNTNTNTKTNIWYRAMFFPESISVDFRNLPRIFKVILNILLYSCYTTSFALEFAQDESLKTILQEPKESIGTHLEMVLRRNWIDLQKMLRMNFNDMGILLHEIVYKSKCLFENQTDMCTSKHFSELLLKNHIQVAKDVIKSRIEVIQKVKNIKECNTECKVEKCVYDIEPCRYDVAFESATNLFRLTSSPSKDVFLAEVQARQGDYPFLSSFVHNMEKLEMPQYILSFMKWHSAVVSCATYKFRKVDFKDISVLHFLKAFEDDELRKKRLENAFRLFSGDCNKLFTKFKDQLREHGIDEEVTSALMHKQVKMPVCTILDEQSVMYKILKVLVNAQNCFIEAALSLSEQENTFIRKLAVQDVRKPHLITFEWDDYWLDYSQCDTRYGLGRKINFYFGNIERDLKQALLVGKTFITLPSMLSKIIFTDDLFQNSIELIKEINKSIPQFSLSSEMKKSLEEKKEKDVSQITELLNHTGMTLSLLRKTKTGIDPDRHLLTYLKEWQNVTGMTSAAIKKLFPEDIRIGQVVNLYQLLEEINGENILETLEDKYRESLTESALHSLSQTKQNNMQYLEKLEHPLKVFIHRCLGVKDNDLFLEQPLKDYISTEDIWWSGDFKEEQVFVNTCPLSLQNLLPPMIVTGHIYEVVQFVIDAIQENKQKETLRSMAFRHSYAPTREAPVQQSKQMKARKLMKF